MSIVFDATVLIDLLNPKLEGERRDKIDHLVATLQKRRSKIIIPTPALTELMVHAGKARDAYHQSLSASAAFQIAPFDSRAAMECALLLKEAWTTAEQKKVTRTKFKFDWQIVSIAASRNAETIYSDDKDIARYGQRVGIKVVKTDELILPESAKQQKLKLDQ